LIGSSVYKRVGYVMIALYGVLLTGIYYSTYAWLIGQDWPREDYTYCYLIPLLVLYLIWEKRTQLAELPSKVSWKGMIPLGVGVSLFCLGELAGEYFTLYFSSWLILVGLCWTHLGWEKLKVIAFPLLIALTMFPSPHFIYNKISVKLQLLSSQLGVSIMRLYGMSAYREGNVIDLGFTQLQVVNACSGLRYIFPLIVLGLTLAYLFRAAFWKRAIVVVSTVPLSMMTNSLRIALTGILYEIWGADVAEGFFHGFSGWFIFMFSFVVLLAEMKVLGFRFKAQGAGRRAQGSDKLQVTSDASQTPDKRERARELGPRQEAQSSRLKAHREESEVNGSNADSPASTYHLSAISSFFSNPQFITAVILLGATLAFSHGIEFREKTPLSKSFSYFPLLLGEWHGTPRTMEQRFVDTLDLSDYAIIDYKNRSGKHIEFYVAYYESQRKGESIHSPATCLPGSGWVFNQTGNANIPIPSGRGGAIPVNRAFMQKGDGKQVSYYWFPQRGRILTTAYQLKLFAFWDALTRQRTDGALVRLITPVYKSEEPKDAEARLQAFTGDILPVLSEFLPD